MALGYIVSSFFSQDIKLTKGIKEGEKLLNRFCFKAMGLITRKKDSSLTV